MDLLCQQSDVKKRDREKEKEKALGMKQQCAHIESEACNLRLNLKSALRPPSASIPLD